MKEEDEWGPETKLWPFVALLCTQITPIEGYHCWQAVCSIPTKPWPLNGGNHPLVAFTGSGKAATKSRPVILQGNTVCRMKVHWTSSPFLVKS